MKTEDQLRQILIAAVEKCGSVQRWADQNSISVSYIRDIVQGRRPASTRVAIVLGFRRRILFERAGR